MGHETNPVNSKGNIEGILHLKILYPATDDSVIIELKTVIKRPGERDY
jgi:hypothetical protein